MDVRECVDKVRAEISLARALSGPERGGAGGESDSGDGDGIGVQTCSGGESTWLIAGIIKSSNAECPPNSRRMYSGVDDDLVEKARWKNSAVLV